MGLSLKILFRTNRLLESMTENCKHAEKGFGNILKIHVRWCHLFVCGLVDDEG